MKENDGTLDKFLKSPGKKGSSPKGNGRQAKIQAENDRIKKLLRLNDSDYPPTQQEVDAATRVIELEKELKGTRRKNQDSVEKELKGEIQRLFRMISTTTTNYDKGGKDDTIELEYMEVEDPSTANATDSQVDQQMDMDSGSEPEVEEVEMEETENTGSNKDLVENFDIDMQNQKSGVDKVPIQPKNPDETASENKTDDSPNWK